MASYNRTILLGNVTRDIELRYINGKNGQTAVCDMSLAVNEKVGGKDEASFIDCTLFGRTAEVANEYLSKGSPVLVEGRLKQETWKDKDGGNRSKVKVIVDKMSLIGKKGDSPAPAGKSADASYQSQSNEHDDDIPF